MHPLLITAWLLTFSGDAVTTHAALSRSGIHEANPFLPQSPIANSAVLTAESVAGAYALHRLHGSHPKLATALLIAGSVIETSAAIHNLHTLQHP